MRFDRQGLGITGAAFATALLTLSLAAPAAAGSTAAPTQDKPKQEAPAKPVDKTSDKTSDKTPDKTPAKASDKTAQPSTASRPQRVPTTVPARPAAAGTPGGVGTAVLSDDERLQRDIATTGPVNPSLSPRQDVAERSLGTGAATWDASQPPAVEFDPPIADLGEMIAGISKSMTVKIRNISSEPIRITKAIANCGCTTPAWPKDPIAPGASGDIEVSMAPGDKAGIRMSKQVTFQLENHPPAVLKVEGDVVAFVTISPDMISEPSEAAATGEKTMIVLQSTDGTPFVITSVAPPVVKGISTEAQTRHEVEFDWANWRETGRQMRVTFSTDNPKAPRLVTIVRRALARDGQNAPAAPAQRSPAGLGTTDLITAVRAADLEKVSSLIAGGADVNELDNAGSRTALHWAARGGNLKAMELLLEAGANPNLPDRGGRSSVWSAIEFGVDAVRFLAEYGADLSARDRLNSTPLLWAAGFGSAETVRFLLENEADPKAIDDNGWTALIWAAGLGQPESVKLLIEAGVDLDAGDRQTGDTPLLRAARTGKVESLKLLIDAKADLAAQNKNGQTALHLAAQSGVPEKVAMLLAAGVDPAAVDLRNWTALDHAMARTTGDKSKLIELLKPVSPASSAESRGKQGDAPSPQVKGG